LCEEIHKEKFTIFDCFDGSLIKYFKDATDFNVSLQREATPLSEIIEAIYDNQDREYNTNRLIKRLRRIEKNMGAEAREAFTRYIPDGDMKAFADRLKNNLAEQFTETMKLLRDKDFQDLLLNYPRPKKVFFKGYDIVDTVEHEVMFRVGGDYQKPEDYLKLFEKFVRRNPEHIEAIDILLSRPKQWGTDALDELRKQLRQSDFSEKDLQRGHALVYKKPLADIISMIKHASDYDVPILTAAERVDAAVEKIVRNHDFNDDQRTWLAYIKEHLIENLAIAEEDFALMPVFERQGGIGAARRVFGDRFEPLIKELNEALAA
ncbi:MAG: type I restriction-modification enzyme R subunit C-terminal domain-containing protein, partial [Thermodesulfobacteriota bacterium]|nr:type I restriction-modification enzyme R subunit C-terminal domain-containing protein [Thermodesulfobacteriota bacterium]